jgi:hypothetical protein
MTTSTGEVAAGHDRSALGPADVPDDVLAGMVARLLGVDDVRLLSSTAEEFPYDVPSITTAGRYWVRGTAATDGRTHDWVLFVKHVQEWSRSPFFAEVPEEIRPLARRMVPWRSEGEAYRSGLSSLLPHGLEMPAAVDVRDIDELSYAVWLEPVPIADVTWDLDRYRQAATLLGRFAANEAVRGVARGGTHEWDVGQYAHGRLAHQVVPVLRSEEVWAHPHLAEFRSLRSRLLSAADRVPELAEELMRFPVLAGHGDGCPGNLLVRPGREGFTMIDFNYFGVLPVGFDLGQLLVGDVQLGRVAAEDLRLRDDACLAAYHRGLLEEGHEIDQAALRRAHALQLMLFTGLTSPPFELLDQEPHADLRALLRTRAELARYTLDLLDETATA